MLGYSHLNHYWYKSWKKNRRERTLFRVYIQFLVMIAIFYRLIRKMSRPPTNGNPQLFFSQLPYLFTLYLYLIVNRPWAGFWMISSFSFNAEFFFQKEKKSSVVEGSSPTTRSHFQLHHIGRFQFWWRKKGRCQNWHSSSSSRRKPEGAVLKRTTQNNFRITSKNYVPEQYLQNTSPSPLHITTSKGEVLIKVGNHPNNTFRYF